MIRLEPHEYDEAVATIGRAWEQAGSIGLQTILGRSAFALEALGAIFDIDGVDLGERFDLPLADDRVDQLMDEIAEEGINEAKRANELMDWVLGMRP